MTIIDHYDTLLADKVKTALRPFLVAATSPAFGAVSKRELELALFQALRELGLIENDASLFSLMTELRVTRAKASQLLFDIEVRSRGSDSASLDGDVRSALMATRFARDGEMFVLEIENPLVQAHLRNKLRELGHVSDASFNSAIVKMPLEAATDIILTLLGPNEQASVKRALVAAGAPDGSVRGVIKSALKALGSKIVGEAAGQLSEGVVAGAEGFLAPVFEGAEQRITQAWTTVLRRPVKGASAN